MDNVFHLDLGDLESILLDIVDRDDNENFLHGSCHIFAVALHEVSGWPLYAWLEPGGRKTCLMHAFVSPDGGLTGVDVKGARLAKEMPKEFPGSWDGGPWLTEIKRSRLLKLGHGATTSTAELRTLIDEAIPLAQSIYALAQVQMHIEQVAQQGAGLKATAAVSRKDLQKHPIVWGAMERTGVFEAHEYPVARTEMFRYADLPEDMQMLVFQFLEEYGIPGVPLEPVEIPVRSVSLFRFPDVELADGVLDERGEAYARQMIGQEVPPVIICGDQWLDGRHRVWSAKQQGQEAISALDMTAMLKDVQTCIAHLLSTHDPALVAAVKADAFVRRVGGQKKSNCPG